MQQNDVHCPCFENENHRCAVFCGVLSFLVCFKTIESYNGQHFGIIAQQLCPQYVLNVVSLFLLHLSLCFSSMFFVIWWLSSGVIHPIEFRMETENCHCLKGHTDIPTPRAPGCNPRHCRMT